jgi:hypothetical protein
MIFNDMNAIIMIVDLDNWILNSDNGYT